MPEPNLLCLQAIYEKEPESVKATPELVRFEQPLRF